jgi:hypothetical protein
METIRSLIRINRAARLAARQERSRAKGLRATLRAGRLAGRKIVTRSGELRSHLQAERLIHRVANTATPSSERA